MKLAFRPVTATLAITSIALLAFAAPALATDRISVAPGFAGYNSTVTAITPPDSNGVRYVGGTFTRFNEIATGASMVTDASSGAIDKSFPRVTGDSGQSSNVDTSVADGSGGYYIGGDFTKVDGQSMKYAAHINSDGSLDTTWAPDIDDEVVSIVKSGSTIYLGGRFWNVGGESHRALASVSASTGAVISSWSPQPDGTVYTIGIDGTTLYVGGEFEKVGSSTRKGLAAIGTDGTLKTWAGDISRFGRVNSLVVSGSTVYVGGTFTTIGGISRNNAAAIGTNGTVASWDPSPNGEVQAVAVDSSTVYLGGWFSKVASTTRKGIAAVGTNGTLSSWNPNITDANNYGVSSLAILGSNLYFGGTFHEVAGTERNDVAAVKLSDATLTSWNPDVNHREGDVYVVSVVGSKLLVGGQFDSAGGTPRLHLAAIDANGDLTSWNPGIQEPSPTDRNYPNDYVSSLLLDGSTVYVAGTLDGTVGGVSRPRIAAIGSDGVVKTSFNPPAITGTSISMSKMGTTLYLTGVSNIGGSTRYGLASVDASTGAAGSWAPSLTYGAATAIVNNGTNLYVGGTFTSARSQSNTNGSWSTRNMLAAFDSSGNLLSWAPNVSISGYSGGVYSMVMSGSNLYLGGLFSGVKNTTRSNAAAVDTSGNLLSWNPNANGVVYGVSMAGSNIFLTGGFTTVGGTSHVYVAAVGTNGTVTTWNPKVDQAGYSDNGYVVSADSSKVAMAGSFYSVDGSNAAGWMFVDAPVGPPSDPVFSGAPTGTTKQTSASIGFTSDSGATFKCSVDGGSYADCTSPKSLSGLAEGAHSLAVKALKNSAESGVSTASWTIDATSPAAPVVTRTSPAATPTKQSTATITYSGELGATFTCSTNGANYSPCTGSPVSLSGLTEGAKTYYVKATDAAGNTSAPGSATWTVDLTPPSAPGLSNLPAALTRLKTASPNFSSEVGATFECSLDGGQFTRCSSPRVISGLADGQHRLAVRAIDPAGNTGAQSTATWRVDSTPPASLVINGVPMLATTVTSISATFTRESGATVRCWLDADPANNCSNGFSHAGLASGTHTINAEATDAAGNTSPTVTATWKVGVTIKFRKGSRGGWDVLLGDVFGPGTTGTYSQQLGSVQFSTDTVKPDDALPVPTKPSFADKVEAYKSLVNVVYSKVPAWARIGTRSGKWTAWIKIVG